MLSDQFCAPGERAFGAVCDAFHPAYRGSICAHVGCVLWVFGAPFRNFQHGQGPEHVLCQLECDGITDLLAVSVVKCRAGLASRLVVAGVPRPARHGHLESNRERNEKAKYVTCELFSKISIFLSIT